MQTSVARVHSKLGTWLPCYSIQMVTAGFSQPKGQTGMRPAAIHLSGLAGYSWATPLGLCVRKAEGRSFRTDRNSGSEETSGQDSYRKGVGALWSGCTRRLPGRIPADSSGSSPSHRAQGRLRGPTSLISIAKGRSYTVRAITTRLWYRGVAAILGEGLDSWRPQTLPAGLSIRDLSSCARRGRTPADRPQGRYLRPATP